MKSIIEKINESKSSYWIVEENRKHPEILECSFDGSKKHGFMFYDDTEGTLDTISLVAVDNAKELSKIYENIDEESAEKIISMKYSNIDLSVLNKIGLKAIYKIW